MIDVIQQHLKNSADAKLRAAAACAPAIARAVDIMAASFKAGGKLLICGNGGSAADAQHMAAEFVSRLTREFVRPAMPALALTTDTSFLTAYANDFDFDGIFARQVEAMGRPGDVLLGISTSGGSRNVVAAVAQARKSDMRVVTLTGQKGVLTEQADVAIAVPETVTAHIQEVHLAIEHVICHLVERACFSGR
jgi:D-sedoheptulose 7-phosphate isomerase